MRKKGLDPVVVHQQVGLLLDVLEECLVNWRVHVTDNWDLDCLVLDLLLATTHGLDNLGTALVSADAVGDVVEVHGGGKSAGAIVFGASPALFPQVCRLPDLVTGLAVQEAVVTALPVDSSLAHKGDGRVGEEFEGLHWHSRVVGQ